MTNIIAVKATDFANQAQFLIQDLATLVNGEIIGNNYGISFSDMSVNQLGNADQIIITKDYTSIIKKETNDNILTLCDNIRKQIKISDSLYDKELLQNRLSRLTGSVATIKVGGFTDTEVQDKKLRLEDAINATKAAILEGVVPGGGYALTCLSDDVAEWSKKNLFGDEQQGALILSRALKLPAKHIIRNAGLNDSLILQKITKMGFGYGFNTFLGLFCDMYQEGILDPAKVSRCSVQNASSVARLVLSTDCIVIE